MFYFNDLTSDPKHCSITSNLTFQWREPLTHRAGMNACILEIQLKSSFFILWSSNSCRVTYPDAILSHWCEMCVHVIWHNMWAESLRRLVTHRQVLSEKCIFPSGNTYEVGGLWHLQFFHRKNIQWRCWPLFNLSARLVVLCIIMDAGAGLVLKLMQYAVWEETAQQSSLQLVGALGHCQHNCNITCVQPWGQNRG